MKAIAASDEKKAFTLLELLCVIAIITILASLLFPAVMKAQARARRVECVSQLRQLGVGFHAFAHDHNGSFPMRLPAGAGGTAESATGARRAVGDLALSYVHLQVLSNELVTPRLLVCPADERRPAISFGTMQNLNVSYFVGLNADYSQPNSILSGDRNLTNDWNQSSSSAVTRVGGNLALRWTFELHQFKGNILLADGHVEEKSAAILRAAINQSPPIAELALPSLPPAVTVPTRSGAESPGSPASAAASPGTLTPLRDSRPAIVSVTPAAEVGIQRPQPTPSPERQPEPKGTNSAKALNSTTHHVSAEPLAASKGPLVSELNPPPLYVKWLTGSAAAAGYVIFLLLMIALLIARLWTTRGRVRKLKSGLELD